MRNGGRTLIFRSPVLLALLFMATAVCAQNRDPLNKVEIDQLRETTQEPDKRVRLIVKFARARLDAIDQLKADPKLSAAERADRTHDLLQDFLSIYDELGDNLDMYIRQHSDLRKPLKEVVMGDSEFRARLLRLKANANADQAKEADFLLTNALEAVNDGTTEHRQMLQDAEKEPRKKK